MKSTAKLLFNRDVLLGQEYLAFLLLNLFDLFLTGYIFSHNGLEANGLAAYILSKFGRRYFAIYKFVMVVVIIGICEIVGTKSVPKARWIMLLGCSVYFGVVLYESYLIYKFITLPAVTQDTSAALFYITNSFIQRFS
jgi:hypothetical protein